MTLIIGANLNHYTILAADTRETWMHPFLGEYHKDHKHKIAICGMGLITGSGYVNALDSVIEELLKKEIYHTNEALNIIKKLAMPKIKLLNINDPNIMEHNTCFLISYLISIDNKNILRLARLDLKCNFQWNIVSESTIVLPFDASKKDNEKYSKILCKGLHRCKESFHSEKEYDKNVLISMGKNIKFFAECFYEISKSSKFVSEELDFAALFSNDTVIYGNGSLKEMISGNFPYIRFHRSNLIRILTPDVLKEGNNFNI